MARARRTPRDEQREALRRAGVSSDVILVELYLRDRIPASGLIRIAPAEIAADVARPERYIREAVRDLADVTLIEGDDTTRIWLYDAKLFVWYPVGAQAENPPRNEKHVAARLKAAGQLPDCAPVRAMLAEIQPFIAKEWPGSGSGDKRKAPAGEGAGAGGQAGAPPAQTPLPGVGTTKPRTTLGGVPEAVPLADRPASRHPEQLQPTPDGAPVWHQIVDQYHEQLCEPAAKCRPVGRDFLRDPRVIERLGIAWANHPDKHWWLRYFETARRLLKFRFIHVSPTNKVEADLASLLGPVLLQVVTAAMEGGVDPTGPPSDARPAA